MEQTARNNQLLKRALWLIRLRCIAIVFVPAVTFFAAKILGIELHEQALYLIAGILAVYNAAAFGLLRLAQRQVVKKKALSVKLLIDFQISADLFLLTAVLHFSGGIENPFIFYYIFHMIISSILLSVRESYMQATYAVLMFGLLVLLEYLNIIPHYCLRGFVPVCLHSQKYFVLGVYFVFVTALYTAVYMASYISTRLKTAEQAYRQANTILLEKDRIKDEYVNRVTHDIKGHLAGIQGCLDVVHQRIAGPLNEQQADFIGRAYDRVQKLVHFVKELLRLTQMRLNRNVQMETFLLKDVINSAIATAKTRSQNKQIILKRDIDPELGRTLADQTSVEEALLNLLFNAIKYTPANGIIEVNAKENGDYCLVEVIDTGIGVAEEDLPMIFDEFYRAANARKVEKNGTGLGLSITKQVIERHGGQIGVESKQNHGSKFWFKLPKVPDEPASLEK